MRYFVTVAGQVVEVDLSGPTPIVDGRPVAAELALVSGPSVYHLLMEAESHPLTARPGGTPGEWHLTLRGQPIHAEVLDERSRTIREMAGTTEIDVPKRVTAPMPGLIVRVLVEVGQELTAGQGLIVMEAMKMENELRAVGPGVVARVQVAPGDAVEKSEVLIVLE